VAQEFDFTQAVIALGKEFARRKMDRQLASLRRFYADLRRRQQEAKRMAQDESRRVAERASWTEQDVITWMMLLRIPPFQPPYPVLPWGARCPGCRDESKLGAATAFTRTSFPGGSVHECRHCGATWMREDTV